MILFISICGGLIVLLKKCTSLFIFLFIIGCSVDDSSSSGGDAEPFPTQEVSGVWLGDFVFEDTDNFAIGIITADHEVRFIGENVQYSGIEGAVSVTPNSSVFSGNIDEHSWIDTDDDYSSDSASLQIGGWIAEKVLLWGSYRNEENQQEIGSLYFYYNTTYEVSPDVTHLEGNWVASNVFEQGNTLTLTITPDPDIEPGIQNTTSGDISGGDLLGNEFSGNITIHYTTENEVEGNVYDVSLTFDGIEMNGLATYVEEMSTEGIEISKKTLVLGVSNPESTYMISVLSTLGN
jgi:hypothetical protein